MAVRTHITRKLWVTAVLVAGLVLLATSCSSATELADLADDAAEATAAPTPEPAASPTPRPTASPEPVASPTAVEETIDPLPALETPCFQLDETFDLAADYIAADVSPNATQCWFVTQIDPEIGLADRTVIAGELWQSGSGMSFEGFVERVEDGLAVGAEPDLFPLGLLNSGASGRTLEVLERFEIDGPNRAVVFLHESDRRSGWSAYSGVVDFNVGQEGEATRAMMIWGLSTPVNDQMLFDLINAMVKDPDFELA